MPTKRKLIINEFNYDELYQGLEKDDIMIIVAYHRDGTLTAYARTTEVVPIPEKLKPLPISARFGLCCDNGTILCCCDTTTITGEEGSCIDTGIPCFPGVESCER